MNQSIQPGGNLGRYQLISRLATGGMAEVWLARATGAKGFQKTIVVKTILPHLADDPDFLRMFIDEALLAAALNHPNIVQIFDLGQIGDTYFIAMEFILGRTMRQVQRLLKKQHKVMPPWLVLRVAMAVCDALDYAHNKRREDGQLLGVVHRDVTPENIMISFTGVIKVVDFGIAKATTGAALTRAGKIKGKLAYLAPEQIVHTGESVVDRRTDIYALGVLLYEMLTGVRPFRAPNDMALLLKIPSVIPPPPSEIARWVPTRLSDIVMKAMAKNPVERYQDARQLGDDLDVFLTSIGTYPTERHVSAYLCKLFPEEERRAPISDWVEQPPRSEQSGLRESTGGSGEPLEVDSSASISIEVSVDQGFAGVGAAGETMRRDELRETAETPVTDLVFIADEEGAEAVAEELRALKDELGDAEAHRGASGPGATPSGPAHDGGDEPRPSLPAPSLRISPDDLKGSELAPIEVETLGRAPQAAASPAAERSAEGEAPEEKAAAGAGEPAKSAPAPRPAEPRLESPEPPEAPQSLLAPSTMVPPPAPIEAPTAPPSPEPAATTAKPEKRSLDALFAARPAARGASWDTVVGRVAADEERAEPQAVDSPRPASAASAGPSLGARWDDIARRAERDAAEGGAEGASAEEAARAASPWDRLGRKAEAAEVRAPVGEKRPSESSPRPASLWDRLGQRAGGEGERAPVAEKRPGEASAKPASIWERSGAGRAEAEENAGAGHLWDRLREKVERELEDARESDERRGGRSPAPRVGSKDGAGDPWSVVRIDPNLEAAASFDEGLELVRQGRNEEALHAWERAVRLAPDNRRYSGNLRMLRKAMEEKS